MKVLPFKDLTIKETELVNKCLNCKRKLNPLPTYGLTFIICATQLMHDTTVQVSH